MSEYIYKPPPPPPPRVLSNANSNLQHGNYNSQRGNFSGNRGRGGYNSGGRGRGNQNHNRGGRTAGGVGRGGGQFQNQGQNFNSQPGYGPQSHTFQQPLNPQAGTQYPHFNPAFFSPGSHYTPNQYPVQQQQFAQQQQRFQQPYVGQLFPQIAPRNFYPQGVNNPHQQPHYLSYAQEHSRPPPQPPLQSYNNFSGPPASGWPVHASYGHYQPPQPPKQKKQQQQQQEKPDMDEKTWLRLNGGKLIGTNIKPPDTPEEIAAWIAQRKANWPTSARIAEKEAAKQSQFSGPPPANSTLAYSTSTEATIPKKRKLEAISAPGSDLDSTSDPELPPNSSSDSEPEEVSTKPHTPPPPAVDSTTNPPKKRKEKSIHCCRDYNRTGRCPRGEACTYKHVDKNQKDGDGREGRRKSLYQRLVEHDREKENVVVLRAIKYLVDKRLLKADKER